MALSALNCSVTGGLAQIYDKIACDVPCVVPYQAMLPATVVNMYYPGH